MMKPEDFVSSKVKDMPFSGIRKFFDVANEIEGVISLGCLLYTSDAADE